MATYHNGNTLDDGTDPQPEELEAEYEAHDEEPYCDHCGNIGILNCYCGGDLCVCENNGKIDCPHCHP